MTDDNKISFLPQDIFGSQRFTRQQSVQDPVLPAQVINKQLPVTSFLPTTQAQNKLHTSQFYQNTLRILPKHLKKCYKILNTLRNSQAAGPFLEPVDPIKLQCFDYFEIVKEPIDLSTIEDKIITGVYKQQSEFELDVKKMIDNSILYNPKTSPVYKLTLDFNSLYLKLITEKQQQFTPVQQKQVKQQSVDPLINLSQKLDHLYKKVQTLNSHKKNSSSTGKQIESSKMIIQQNEILQNNKPITYQERKQLGINIKKLSQDYLKGICEILIKEKFNGTKEFDLLKLEDKTIRELQYYVRGKLKVINKATQRKNKQSSTRQFEKSKNVSTNRKNRDILQSNNSSVTKSQQNINNVNEPNKQQQLLFDNNSVVENNKTQQQTAENMSVKQEDEVQTTTSAVKIEEENVLGNNNLEEQKQDNLELDKISSESGDSKLILDNSQSAISSYISESSFNMDDEQDFLLDNFI